VTDAQALGVLGGAFDPVHIGHLRGAIAVREHLGLERVNLLPAAQSPLKGAATVTAADRLAMLEAAVRGVPGLGVDARELDREGPSIQWIH
jgi:nicotinate-nucleotide adenylyltransferase